ncbi:MAG: transcription antitermination protein NusB [Flavobacteriaceae bacterium]|nr:transcription antitermination protein NusB [Flavobacteriaceae bacterium]
MLNRRHIRIKAMQSIFSYFNSRDAQLKDAENFYRKSLQDSYGLYTAMNQLLVELLKQARTKQVLQGQKKMKLEDKDFSLENFINHPYLNRLEESLILKKSYKQYKKNPWYLGDEYVRLLFDEIFASEQFGKYAKLQQPTPKQSTKFLKEIYTEMIAPNDKIYDYIEDVCLTWVDDYPLINTVILKQIEAYKYSPTFIEPLFADLIKFEEDLEFGVELIRKTLLNDEFFDAEIEGKTPNWDKERIAGIDLILIKMAICEYLKFSSIPVKVSLNEYLEIAKDYSTPKSNIFINGVLDRLLKEYTDKNMLNKSARGLL